MKKITILHLDNCPYCRHARRALEALREENPVYREVEAEWVEEEREPEKARAFTTYWYVPTIYCGQEKLYEAQPGQTYEQIKEKVRGALETVLQP